MKVKKAITILFIGLLALSSTSCLTSKYKYKGEYPELYSIAVNSILGASGSSPGEWGPFPVFLETWEEDGYGRKTFFYSEGDMYSLLISQKTDEKYAYFYPDYNFVNADAKNNTTVGMTAIMLAQAIESEEPKVENCFGYYRVDEPKNLFTEEIVEELKAKNDWGKEIDLNKCAKVETQRKKIQPEIDKKRKKDFETISKKVAKEAGCKGDDSVFRFARHCISDDYGRTLYYVYGIHRDVKGEGMSPKSEMMDIYFTIIFNPDGTFNEETCAMRLIDRYNYQDNLKAFKDLNNWNKPY